MDADHRHSATGWIVGLAILLAASGGVGWLAWHSIRNAGAARTPEVVVVIPPQPGAQIDGGPAPAPAPLPQAQDPGATLVSLKVDRVSPRQAVEALAQASGIAVRSIQPEIWDRIKDRPVTLSLERRPFWEALSGICRQAGVWPQNMPAGDGIVLGDDTAGRRRCPGVVGGSFLITAYQIQHTVAWDGSSANPPSHLVRVELTLLAEPKLRPGLAGVRGTIEEAVDESGKSLLTGGRMNLTQQLPPTAPTFGWFQVFLPYSQGAGKRIARLKGYASARMEKSKAVEITNLGKPGEVINTSDGFGVQFKQLVYEDGRSAVEIETSGPPQQLMQRFRSPSSLVKVVDNRGRVFPGVGWTGSPTGGAGVFRVGFNNTNIPNVKPAKVILSVPMELSEIHVPFEFTNLPLP